MARSWRRQIKKSYARRADGPRRSDSSKTSMVPDQQVRAVEADRWLTVTSTTASASAASLTFVAGHPFLEHASVMQGPLRIVQRTEPYSSPQTFTEQTSWASLIHYSLPLRTPAALPWHARLVEQLRQRALDLPVRERRRHRRSRWRRV